MFYVEMLRARNTLLVSAGVLIALALAALGLLALWPSHLHAVTKDQTAFMTIGWIAALVTAIAASFLGASLASENCTHLEIAWTKPISRTAYAAGLFLIDLACLAIIFLIAFALAYGVVSLYVSGPVHIALDTSNAWQAARFALFPVAWFGIGQAITSGARGAHAGAAVGLMWPVAELISLMAARPLGSIWHTIFSVLNLANPIAYFPFWEFDDNSGSAMRNVFGYGLTIDTLALAALAIIGVVIAMARWRRLEA